MKQNLYLPIPSSFSLLIVFILSIIFYFVYSYMSIQEEFTTYIRQTVRPRIRTFRDVHNTVTYHFNTKFKHFGRTLGIF